MAIFKCKMCGGSLEVQPGATVAECEYCGTQQTLPQADDEQKLNRYNRANHFRAQCEFDKAVAAYEKILEQDDADAEAHWGAVISRFGIEYVEDPVTHRRVPTCHRVQVASILTDDDYLAAVKNAPDTLSASLYKEQAAEIAEIQKGILAISANEQPYDVFICYKETDENGQRTHDSALAQDVYYGLTEQGYKVFFSRITLEDKLGREYEPYIFAALNSAKVMVVIGTKPEYFNAVWVKNEWSRYLALMAKDRKRLLIPCYRGMDPYDLPEELSSLQSQDMSKIGFMQDLLRGIKKVLAAEEPKPVKETVVVNNVGAAGAVEPLVKRGYMALEDGSYDEADGYFERALDGDAENARAYLGKLFAEEQVPDADALKKKRLRGLNDIGPEQRMVPKDEKALQELQAACPIKAAFDASAALKALIAIDRSYPSCVNAAKTALDREEARWRNDRFYARAVQFAAGAQKKETEALVADVINAYRERLEREKQAEEQARAQRQAAYEKAVAVEKQKQIGLYEERLEKLYREACDEAQKAVKSSNLRYVARSFEKIVGYKDAAGKAKEYAARAQEAEQKEKAAAEAEEKAAKRKKTIIAVAVAVAVAVAAALAILYAAVIAPASAYSNAQKLYAEGQFEEAKAAFIELGDYKDSATQVTECDYAAAKALLSSGSYEEAYKAFCKLKGYKDVDTLLKTDKNLKWQIGNVVTIGNYPQGENGETVPVEWQVLDVKDGRALLISKYAMDCRQYNEKNVDITWEKCTLRSWLNWEFLNKCFSSEEQASIVTPNVPADENPKYSTNPGNVTQDKVFLLSIAETEKYFKSNDDRMCVPTAYAVGNGCWTSDNYQKDGQATCYWWLRSPGYTQDSAARVGSGGDVYRSGSIVNYGSNAVRPALWVKIS